jgi:hypothetical protein
VTVTVDGLAVLLRVHSTGELPVAIRPGAVWTDDAGDREAQAAAWTEFREVRWVDGRGLLADDAADCLDVLGRPSVEYTAIVARDGRQDSIVLAGRGDVGVLAVRKGDAVTLTPVRHRAPAETLLRQVPDVPPAPVDALNVRIADAATGSTPDARLLADLGRRPLVGQGELYVAVRDRHGRRQLSPPLRYQDYRIGRVVVVAADGYLSVAPGTKSLLLTRLREAHHELIA